MKAFYHEAQVEVDGEILHLVLDFRAIDVVESLMGEPFDSVVPQLIDGRTGPLTKFLWAILRENHDGITLDNAVALVRDEKHGKALALVLGDLLQRAGCVGDPNEEVSKEPNPRKRRGTSKTSSKSGLQPALVQ
jgi:hypothetical protein